MYDTAGEERRTEWKRGDLPARISYSLLDSRHGRNGKKQQNQQSGGIYIQKCTRGFPFLYISSVELDIECPFCGIEFLISSWMTCSDYSLECTWGKMTWS